MSKRLSTKINTGDKVDCRRYVRLCRRFVAGFGDKPATTGIFTSHVMISSLVTSFRYNGRRRCDLDVSCDKDNNSCSCCKETSPTQSVMLGARLDAAQATVTLTKRSSLIFMKFRLCRPSVHTGDKVEFDSLSRSTLSSTRSTLSNVGDFCRPNVERSFDFVASVYRT